MDVLADRAREEEKRQNSAREATRLELVQLERERPARERLDAERWERGRVERERLAQEKKGWREREARKLPLGSLVRETTQLETLKKARTFSGLSDLSELDEDQLDTSKLDGGLAPSSLRKEQPGRGPGRTRKKRAPWEAKPKEENETRAPKEQKLDSGEEKRKVQEPEPSSGSGSEPVTLEPAPAVSEPAPVTLPEGQLKGTPEPPQGKMKRELQLLGETWPAALEPSPEPVGRLRDRSKRVRYTG